MFTLKGHPLGNVWIKVDPDTPDSHLAIVGVYLVDDQRELTEEGLEIFIEENWERLNDLCAEAYGAMQDIANQAPRATLH